MADDEKRFSESEHLAVLADRVEKETADKSARIAELETENAELQSKLDVTEAEKVAALQRAETAEAAHETFKNEVAEREAAAARKDERLAKAKEVASHLGEAFFEDAKRIERIVAMKDEDFDVYVGDLAATAPAKGQETNPPRETAMAGAGAQSQTSTSSARSVLLGRFGQSSTKEG